MINIYLDYNRTDCIDAAIEIYNDKFLEENGSIYISEITESQKSEWIREIYVVHESRNCEHKFGWSYDSLLHVSIYILRLIHKKNDRLEKEKLQIA